MYKELILWTFLFLGAWEVFIITVVGAVCDEIYKFNLL